MEALHRLLPKCEDITLEQRLRNQSAIASKTVFACMGHATICSNATCCAERRMLRQWVERARRSGVAEIVHWVRPKAGSSIMVWRLLADGQFSCAVPCVFCRKALNVFRPEVVCSVEPSAWFAGHLTDEDAPPPKLTLG